MKRNTLLVLFLFGLSISGFAQKTKNETTSCTALPCVVATVSLANQSTSATQVPLYTPPVDGTFRISVYMTTSADDNNDAYWVALFGWTDELATRNNWSIYIHQSNYVGQSIVANDLAGKPLAYSVRPHAGGIGGSNMTYNLTIVVEQLR